MLSTSSALLIHGESMKAFTLCRHSQNFLHYLSTLYSKYFLYKNCRVCQLSKWPFKWRSPFNACDVSTLLAVKAGNLGLAVKKSSIPDNSAAVGVFASRRMGRGEEVGHFCNTLIYGYVKARLFADRVYGYGIVAVQEIVV